MIGIVGVFDVRYALSVGIFGADSDISIKYVAVVCPVDIGGKQSLRKTETVFEAWVFLRGLVIFP